MIYCHSTNNKINKTIKKLIMKRAILSVLLLFAFLTGFAQNRNICRLGITYDISQSDHWGKNKPVITSVIPYSPAELAGVKTNDIIIAIDGVQTTDISSEEIGEMLNPAGKNEVLLTRTIGHRFFYVQPRNDQRTGICLSIQDNRDSRPCRFRKVQDVRLLCHRRE